MGSPSYHSTLEVPGLPAGFSVTLTLTLRGPEASREAPAAAGQLAVGEAAIAPADSGLGQGRGSPGRKRLREEVESVSSSPAVAPGGAASGLGGLDGVAPELPGPGGAAAVAADAMPDSGSAVAADAATMTVPEPPLFHLEPEPQSQPIQPMAAMVAAGSSERSASVAGAQAAAAAAPASSSRPAALGALVNVAASFIDVLDESQSRRPPESPPPDRQDDFDYFVQQQYEQHPETVPMSPFLNKG